MFIGQLSVHHGVPTVGTENQELTGTCRFAVTSVRQSVLNGVFTVLYR